MSELRWQIKPDERAMVEYVLALVLKRTQNVLGPAQESMIISRLRKRMIELQLGGPSDYLNYLKKNRETEEDVLVSLLTTHHTFFFREFSHFETLKLQLPYLIDKAQRRGDKKIKIWSAACSNGPEVYSLVMFLDYHMKEYRGEGIDFEIIGSDVDPKSVQKATNAVYYAKDVLACPRVYLAKHWARGTGDIADFAKAKSTLREKTRFFTASLTDFKKEIGHEKFDVIFCRNVFIYFGQEQVIEISKALIKTLNPGGFLVTGLSESLTSFDLGIKPLSTSFYQVPPEELKIAKEPVVNSGTHDDAATETAISIPTPTLVPKPSGPVRLFSVDDSKTILILLKKMVASFQDVELVGTASNGLEAAEWLKENKADVMTLDIHMPELDGLGFLAQKYRSQKDPKVIVLSSVSREDSEIVGKALSLGALDFVEKPTIQNMKDVEEELLTKIKILGKDRSIQSGKVQSVALNGRKSKLNPSECLCAMVGTAANLKDMLTCAAELIEHDISVVLLFRAGEGVVSGLAQQINNELNVAVSLIKDGALTDNKASIVLGQISEDIDGYRDLFPKAKFNCLLDFCQLRQEDREKVVELQETFLFVDEVHGDQELNEVACGTTPVTSFPYLVVNYFSEISGEEKEKKGAA